MDIQLRKIHFVQEFLRLNNEELIGKLEDLLTTEKKKLYEAGLQPYTVEKYNLKANAAEEDAKYGRTKKADDLLREIDSWE